VTPHHDLNTTHTNTTHAHTPTRHTPTHQHDTRPHTNTTHAHTTPASDMTCPSICMSWSLDLYQLALRQKCKCLSAPSTTFSAPSSQPLSPPFHPPILLADREAFDAGDRFDAAPKDGGFAKKKGAAAPIRKSRSHSVATVKSPRKHYI
jgi:hypothetical protein